MHRSVLDAVELAEKGYRAQKIKDILEKTESIWSFMWGSAR